MRIAFDLDGRNIEGEFTGAGDWYFKSDNAWFKEHFPDGFVQWNSIPVTAYTGEQNKILYRLKGFSDLVMEVIKALDEQDYPSLNRVCASLSAQNTLPNTRYVVAPSMRNTSKLLDYRIEFQKRKGDTEFYKPEPLIDLSIYEVKQTYDTSSPNYLTGYDFVELFARA